MAKATESGKLRGKVKIGVDDTGKSIYKYVSADTQKELELAKQAAREHFVYLSSFRMSVYQLMNMVN